MQELKIAISGGGIASLCLAYALARRHPQWDIKVFEAGESSRDEGAALGLGENAQAALALISPGLRNALDEAGAVRMEPSVRVMMGTGKDSGRHIGDIKPAVPQMVVHRARFWGSLHRMVPDGVVEFGKRLVTVKPVQRAPCLELHFDDGASYEADALVGCDGINSVTRKIVLGDHHPAAAPIYTAGHNHRVVVPLEEAREAFGEEYCSLRTQYGWVGDCGFLLTDHIDEGKSMQMIAGWSRGEAWPHSTPFVEWPKDRLQSDLADWGEVGKAMTKIFMNQPKLYAAAGRVHRDTPTYCKGAVCIAGDAAQSFPPFQGAGAGQAIEDALMLSTVLGACERSEDIQKAFEVYDSLRRPRRADVARSSSWAALLLTGRAPGIALDVDGIAACLPTWASNIYHYDLAAAQVKALELMGR